LISIFLGIDEHKSSDITKKNGKRVAEIINKTCFNTIFQQSSANEVKIKKKGTKLFPTNNCYSFISNQFNWIRQKG